MHAPIREYRQKAYPDGNITQYFGENPTLYARWGLKAHNGIDIVAAHGTDLLAVEDATVIDVKLSPDGYGKHIRLLSDRHVSNLYRQWVYGHCSVITAKVGDKVKAGDKIAEMGNTGFVVSGANPYWKYNPYAGTHLHLGLRLVHLNPQGYHYPGSDIRMKVDNYENGYKGAVNPAPYFENTTNKRQQLLTIVSLLKTLLSLLKAQK
jgi:murein DD-endopeptidase MepM/ murein hydrolase activator NlpD